jgi:hypothetical protein
VKLPPYLRAVPVGRCGLTLEPRWWGGPVAAVRTLYQAWMVRPKWKKKKKEHSQ